MKTTRNEINVLYSCLFGWNVALYGFKRALVESCLLLHRKPYVRMLLHRWEAHSKVFMCPHDLKYRENVSEQSVRPLSPIRTANG